MSRASVSHHGGRVQRPQPEACSGWRRARLVLLALSVALAAGGCSTLGYYGQAVGGQFEIWRRQAPIAEVLARPDLPAPLRAKLELVVAARRFAVQRLALPDNDSYRDYVDLGREAVVWNVFAAPALDLAPVKSCFPIAGCLEYRGYFAQAAAERHAASLRAQGYDVFVGGVAAYSTLGWFDDPMLSTVLAWNDERIAEILFHELAHQRVYLAGDTTFNESYAMAVGEAGVADWLATRAQSARDWQAAQAREQAFIALLLEARSRLAALYAGDLRLADKLVAKARAFAALRERYARLKSDWGGDTRYDAWMAEDLNNAKLASIATYHDHLPAFHALLAHCGRDYAHFHAAVERLTQRPAKARRACLSALVAPAPATPGLPVACAGLLPDDSAPGPEPASPGAM